MQTLVPAATEWHNERTKPDWRCITCWPACAGCHHTACVPVRFEVEENLLQEEELAQHRLGRYDPVLYCYELQLQPVVHRKGLGRRLMQMLELVVSGESSDSSSRSRGRGQGHLHVNAECVAQMACYRHWQVTVDMPACAGAQVPHAPGAAHGSAEQCRRAGLLRLSRLQAAPQLP